MPLIPPVVERPRLPVSQASLSEYLVELAPVSSVSQGTASFERARPARITTPTRLIGSAWFAPAVEQLESAMALPIGWDSYGGAPASVNSVEKALSFMALFLNPESIPPTVVPLSDGGVQLVWHENGLDVEATFALAEPPEVYVRETATNDEFDVDPNGAPGRDALREAFQRLSG